MGTAGTASAQSIEIENAGFEAVVFDDDEFLNGIDGGSPGWEGVGGDGDPKWIGWGGWNPPADAYPSEAPRGQNVAWLYVDPGFIKGEVAIFQELKATVRAGATYTLTVAIGNPMEYFSERYQEQFFFEGFPGYRIELLAGDTIVASEQNARSPAEGTFERTSVCFAAQDDSAFAGLPLIVRLVNTSEGPGIEVDFDDVQLTVSQACRADMDGDGDVDADDFFIYLDEFAQGCD